MSQFITELDVYLKPERDDAIWVLDKPLVYYSSLLKSTLNVPVGFETDLSSVPRVPFIYSAWGGRAHREGVIHDYLFRTDSFPSVSFSMANKVFLEAMEVRGKPRRIRWPMFLGVVCGGWWSYHKRLVGDKL